ncbi:guanine nucleotide exchange protein for ADP-robosylation factor [Saitoella coloradoensis]
MGSKLALNVGPRGCVADAGQRQGQAVQLLTFEKPFMSDLAEQLPAEAASTEDVTHVNGNSDPAPELEVQENVKEEIAEGDEEITGDITTAAEETPSATIGLGIVTEKSDDASAETVESGTPATVEAQVEGDMGVMEEVNLDTDPTTSSSVEKDESEKDEQSASPNAEIPTPAPQDTPRPPNIAIERPTASEVLSTGEPLTPSIPPGTPRAPVAVPPSPSRQSTRPHTSSGHSTMSVANGSSTSSSILFVVQALESISASKEGKRKGPLRDATVKALDAIRDHKPSMPPIEILFAPLEYAASSGSVNIQITALDSIAKLISYSYLPATIPRPPPADPSSIVPAQRAQAPTKPLLERAVDVVCACFSGEGTDERVSLQIVKALSAAVLNSPGGPVLHQASLLQAVRQVYNIFLLSRGPANQMVAQGTLTQMVTAVFSRVRTTPVNKSTISVPATEAAVEEGGESAGTIADQSEPVTLAGFENRKSFDKERPAGLDLGEDDADDDMNEDEAYVKDAFLVFRAMCKLAVKPAGSDGHDLRSHSMRSKLLALHIILTILNEHGGVFTSPHVVIRSSSTNEATHFVHAVKQYLCLCLSRNAASPVPQVFEVSCEIFYRMLRDMRQVLKKAIELFLNEIYLPILEMRNSSLAQKQYLLGVLARVCEDPRALVEVYLNYDCDQEAIDNMYERIMNVLSKITTTPVRLTPQQQQAQAQQEAGAASGSLTPSLQSTPSTPHLSTASFSTMATAVDPALPIEYQLKRQSLECLVTVLRSLVSWSQQGIAAAQATLEAAAEEAGEDAMGEVSLGDESKSRPSFQHSISGVGTPNSGGDGTGFTSPRLQDDPDQFETLKQRKTLLSEAIRKFNFKPKRGVAALKETGFIRSDEPEEIAKFLLTTEGLNKAMVGEFLGEGETENIAIMHAFVDAMDFTKTKFVDALRRFLQSFRLPGEAQKIDRFMLKFAERYMQGNPNAFANADTAYVLAYSVIMLNTDAHNPQIKNRMTKQDFVKNNRGINDNADLPPEYLGAIYDEIQANEIVMKDEQDAQLMNATPLVQPAQGFAANISTALATVGRDLQREAYVLASEEMANKTEALFKNLIREQRRGKSQSPATFYSASHFKHVRPMFEVAWMPILAALSSCMQENDSLETIQVCMEGFKHAIRIVCLFDLELARNAFVTTLANFTHLNNLGEMRSKNVEAMKALLDIALTEGNNLRGSWKDVLFCVSQLERFQLISSGVDAVAIPEVSRARPQQRTSGDSGRPRASMQLSRAAVTRPRSNSTLSYAREVAEETRSIEVTIAVDKIFTNSALLTGEAIVDFVKALSEVSWEEIQSSGHTDNPRMFSLQKVVEISYYNMGRIRMQWSNIWAVLGDHFNQVGCHRNTNVAFFALDSLRQLSMRFLEIEELPLFKFQKDFLKPFEYVMSHTETLDVKDMILRCLLQMVQARSENIKSGWRTMFGVLSFAAKEQQESVTTFTFDIVKRVYREKLGVIIAQGSFQDLVVCLSEVAKNQRFQKLSLQALEALKATIPNMLASPECPLSRDYKPSKEAERTNTEDPMVKFWYPILFAFQDILMTGEDLEVRSKALRYLFDTLTQYGGDFTPEFWDTVCRQLLFPIFIALKSKSEMAKFNTQEDMSVWLSTTMIQALRNLVSLFTHYFGTLEHMLDGLLELLVSCICQENDTLARIGTSCLQQLIIQSVNKLQKVHWAKIVGTFVSLFDTTTAYQLFAHGKAAEEANAIANESNPGDLRISGVGQGQGEGEGDGDGDVNLGISKADEKDLENFSRPADASPTVSANRKKEFKQIIVKCVLQLLLIDTVAELLENDDVYSTIPSSELLNLMQVLRKSFQFARKFNNDKELRMHLWKIGFMKQLPNLLKQESSSAATYIAVLLRMYNDTNPDRVESKDNVEEALLPLSIDIVQGYSALDEETEQRHIAAWRPVVVEILTGYKQFSNDDFKRHLSTLYPLGVALLNRELGPEVRFALQGMLKRAGTMFLKGKGKDVA